MTHLRLFLILLVSLYGCAETGEDVKSLNLGEQTVAEFDQQYARGVCDLNTRCGLNILPELNCAEFAVLPPLIDLSSASVNQILADECLKGLGQMSCLEVGEELLALDGLFRKCLDAVDSGRTADQSCWSRRDCELGLHCRMRDETTCGICVPSQTDCGERTCVDAQYCAIENGEPQCVERSEAGEDCFTTEQCLPDLVCFEGQCALPGTVGADCASGTCEDGLFCVGSTCNRVTLNLRAGDQCDAVARRCGNGLKCFGADATQRGTCGHLASIGSECTASQDCVMGAYCAGDDVCVAMKGIGIRCESGSECISGVCENGECTQLTGERCN